jgi:hypothetical protein
VLLAAFRPCLRLIRPSWLPGLLRAFEERVESFGVRRWRSRHHECWHRRSLRKRA